MCEHILNFPSVKALVASEEKFDLILGEIMMDESILAGFSSKLNAPIVAFSTTMPSHYANYLVSYNYFWVKKLGYNGSRY